MKTNHLIDTLNKDIKEEIENKHSETRNKFGQNIEASKTGIGNQIKQNIQTLNDLINAKHLETNGILGQNIDAITI